MQTGQITAENIAQMISVELDKLAELEKEVKAKFTNNDREIKNIKNKSTLNAVLLILKSSDPELTRAIATLDICDNFFEKRNNLDSNACTYLSNVYQNIAKFFAPNLKVDPLSYKFYSHCLDRAFHLIPCPKYSPLFQPIQSVDSEDTSSSGYSSSSPEPEVDYLVDCTP